MKKLLLASMCLLTALSASARDVTCDIAKNDSKSVNRLIRVIFNLDKAQAGKGVVYRLYDGEVVSYPDNRSVFLNLSAQNEESFSFSETSAEYSVKAGETLRDELVLVKKDSNLRKNANWVIRKETHRHFGPSGCVEGEDFHCSGRTDLVEETSVKCTDSQDSLPPYQPTQNDVD